MASEAHEKKTQDIKFVIYNDEQTMQECKSVKCNTEITDENNNDVDSLSKYRVRKLAIIPEDNTHATFITEGDNSYELDLHSSNDTMTQHNEHNGASVTTTLVDTNESTGHKCDYTCDNMEDSEMNNFDITLLFGGDFIAPENDEFMGGSAIIHLIRKSRKVSSVFVKEMFNLPQTDNNIKLLGSKRGVEAERARSNRSRYIIHPLSKFRLYWDLVIMVMVIGNLFVLPLDIAFFTETWLCFHIASDILCMFDVIMNFRTGYRTKEMKTYELDEVKIAKRYLKTWFIIDFISSLPLHYFIVKVYGENRRISGASRALKFMKLLKLINLLKLLRLSRIIRGVLHYEQIYRITFGLMRYVKLISMMMVVAHWNGCLHFFVPMLQDFPPNCWVTLCQLENEPWYSQYGWALFKTLSHMLCIGYGRFIPMLLSEAFLTIFTMVTGATFYALFIASSMAYMLQYDSSRVALSEKVKQINEYLSHQNVSDDIKNRVDTYLNQKYRNGKYLNTEGVLSELSKPIKDDIIVYTCKDIVQKISFLRNATSDVVAAILSKVSSEVYLPKDVVVSEGNTNSELYFVRNGELVITVRDKFIKIVMDGDYFGEVAVLTGQKAVYTVKAVTACNILIISVEDFKMILDEHPQMKVLLEHIAIERLLRIYKECELVRRDGYKMSMNLPCEDTTFISMIKLRELFITTLKILLDKAGITREEEPLIKSNEPKLPMEVECLITLVMQSHRQLHGECKLCACQTEPGLKCEIHSS